jgi:hypothetical protein
LRNIVFAHLNSDLPLVFWWQGELSEIFTESLHSVIDRLVFDSAEWAKPAEAWGRIEAAVAEGGGRLVVQDLEWTRGYAWRLALASVFDDPRAVGELGGLRTIRIIYGAGHRVAALQMLAWIMVQTGLRRGRELILGVVSRAGDVEGFSLEHPGGGLVSAALESRVDGAALATLTMEGGSLRLEVVCRCPDRHLEVVCEIGGRREVALLPGGPDTAVGLVDELLSRGGRNGLLVKILPVFRELLG